MSSCSVNPNVAFEEWDKTLSFYKSKDGKLKVTASKLAALFVALLIVVAQGGKGKCSKMSMQKGTQVPVSGSDVTDKAEIQHPESMSGALPKGLLAVLNSTEDFVIPKRSSTDSDAIGGDDEIAPIGGAADVKEKRFLVYSHLFCATFNVSM